MSDYNSRRLNDAVCGYADDERGPAMPKVVIYSGHQSRRVADALASPYCMARLAGPITGDGQRATFPVLFNGTAYEITVTPMRRTS